MNIPIVSFVPFAGLALKEEVNLHMPRRLWRRSSGRFREVEVASETPSPCMSWSKRGIDRQFCTCLSSGAACVGAKVAQPGYVPYHSIEDVDILLNTNNICTSLAPHRSAAPEAQLMSSSHRSRSHEGNKKALKHSRRRIRLPDFP